MNKDGNMRYFVVQTLKSPADLGPGEGEMETTDVRLVPCEDSLAVHKAIVEVRDADGGGWHVFEMVGSRAVSRAVVFKYDGTKLYGVRISYDVEVM